MNSVSEAMSSLEGKFGSMEEVVEGLKAVATKTLGKVVSSEQFLSSIDTKVLSNGKAMQAIKTSIQVKCEALQADLVKQRKVRLGWVALLFTCTIV